MAMTRYLVMLGVALCLAACAGPAENVARIDAVYVADFRSDAPASCRSSDVPLNHAQAAQFFRQAKAVDYRTLHDHYDIAPCHIEGTLKQGGQSCTWKIRAGATGSIQCAGQTQHFACDTCGELFGEK